MQHIHQQPPLQQKTTRIQSSNITALVTCCSTRKKWCGCSVMDMKVQRHFAQAWSKPYFTSFFRLSAPAKQHHTTMQHHHQHTLSYHATTCIFTSKASRIDTLCSTCKKSQICTTTFDNMHRHLRESDGLDRGGEVFGIVVFKHVSLLPMHLPTSTSPALPPPTTRLPSTGGAATTHTLHSIYQWRDKKTRCSDEEVTPASNGNRKITHECATNWQPWAVNNQERLLRRFVGRRHLSVFCTIKIKRSVVERTVFPPDLQKLHFELRDGTFQSRSSALTMIRPTTAAESQCLEKNYDIKQVYISIAAASVSRSLDGIAVIATGL
ncbi:uncharacterized protein CLAFUR5_04182 [Fulvia fulva]|uniref:Uncharacterized protein n=1 Tax=Passalora fulva TaxID=5499 RepID=A0A9Q8P765_PASFU|nr:uncharacterized protein CLAFUR5_04182 [Fulvia fulva]KAK4628371.1 hypothetical protein CLAFUR0_04204 [Fulvia fulva]UJO15733.1 hypothetical protein CLAFUR5_04182 [Fulvia fulva]